ncbi:MAG TPA: STAS domain-containing protein [Frankiaceae bacterium]|nr:STAS domain-containing protein [Frankiaceae bacterium]
MQQPGLTVTYTTDPDAVITVSGELDVATAPALREAFLTLLNRDEVPDVTIDASGVSFCDSSGLAVLLMGARRWSSEEKRLVLRSPSRSLGRILDLAGVRRAFEVCE